VRFVRYQKVRFVRHLLPVPAAGASVSARTRYMLVHMMQSRTVKGRPQHMARAWRAPVPGSGETS
jgi:hypothetical protein